MKAIGWYLESIGSFMAHLPRDLDSSKNKENAENILLRVSGFVESLNNISNNSDLKTILDRLKNSNSKEIRAQYQEIDKFIISLAKMIELLNYDLDFLKTAIEKNNSKLWVESGSYILMGIQNICRDESGELKKEFDLMVHKEEELTQLILDEQELESIFRRNS